MLEALIHESFPAGHITFHGSLRKTRQELLSWVADCFGWIALSDLLPFLLSLVSSFTCWGGNIAFLESSSIWHVATAVWLPEPTTSKAMEMAACSVGYGTPRMSSSVSFHWRENLPALSERPSLNYKFFHEGEPTRCLDPGLYNEEG